ncbi:MAG: hypothetical protein COU81_02565 [Candidatus Portnoybacteria bacterium CG10_big_fil_rev_8_21_14_0_10_36_7]|uniref:Uncharacterized protein n=1 Tax=Candidatus Portnoybacteria bacterium CG10_big_fil_rev_8_21_14_0_10_36_7 TaxID=1974812 RepID=A0A2M8KDV7_9BACT|nr:MAG: hypothetical protein COU81_02565 [Candidatus Portnoybacteria bacterium CG10_big_fil_rev_8_21_14_0_10_36_7]
MESPSSYEPERGFQMPNYSEALLYLALAALAIFAAKFLILKLNLWYEKKMLQLEEMLWNIYPATEEGLEDISRSIVTQESLVASGLADRGDKRVLSLLQRHMGKILAKLYP